jgi:aspartate ammonia-lyase
MLNNIRIEEDLLGTREVPADAYYGVHTLRAIENFYISNNKISDIPEFVRGMVMVKKAAALANKELQTIPKSIANAIVAACDEVLNNGKCMDQFPVDVYQGGAGTSVNMNPTGFRIAVYTSVVKLIDAIKQLGEGFENKAVEFKDILKMGRTQLQDAVPMTLGQEFHAFNVLLNEETKNLLRTAELLLEVNLGATAIGTRLNTPDGYQQLAVQKLAEVSNLPVVAAEDLIEATSDCGAYVMVHSSLKRLAVKLSKICNDLRLLSSGPRAGLNEINLPELQAGSSIMPAKVNPVVPEVVNQVCFKVIGNDITVTMASEAGQLQLNVMEPVIGQAMFESIHILTNACYNLLEKCINGITANKEVCESYVYNSIGIVTYLNPFIGHHNGDIVGKICAETGKSVREVVLERGLLTETELDDIFSAQNLMHPAYKAKRYTDESEQ